MSSTASLSCSALIPSVCGMFQLAVVKLRLVWLPLVAASVSSSVTPEPGLTVTVTAAVGAPASATV
ncbi:MAG: hypothetical protein ERJ67_03080 [Aphanocapsa feldmannii 277cV]|uniref:Uncharacterized protein n=1 Tax=Aphanocapsa feldmannii 277cV TaxID=2507553 RepID=A0A524RPV1_9CHRO|nr:MAG: hypothetical protein ERJ67_03080 [Aphanocapsa feldmannii 277cV]